MSAVAASSAASLLLVDSLPFWAFSSNLSMRSSTCWWRLSIALVTVARLFALGSGSSAVFASCVASPGSSTACGPVACVCVGSCVCICSRSCSWARADSGVRAGSWCWLARSMSSFLLTSCRRRSCSASCAFRRAFSLRSWIISGVGCSGLPLGCCGLAPRVGRDPATSAHVAPPPRPGLF